MSTAPGDKSELRARLRALRRKLARANPLAAQFAAGNFPQDLLAKVKVAAAYHPQGAELDPGPLVARLRVRSTIALPAGERREQPLVFRIATPGAPMVIDAYGIAGPPPSAPAARPDLLIVPLLAFDGQGRRLGQGAGAYDRTIANLRAVGSVFVLGLAYRGQEIDQIPDEPHDQRLDGVLTETGYREFC